jgi:hypothetical protein
VLTEKLIYYPLIVYLILLPIILFISTFLLNSIYLGLMKHSNLHLYKRQGFGYLCAVIIGILLGCIIPSHMVLETRTFPKITIGFIGGWMLILSVWLDTFNLSSKTIACPQCHNKIASEKIREWLKGWAKIEL